MTQVEKLWTIPYIDQPISFWEKLDTAWGKYIDEVYMPFPDDVVSSGRPLQPDNFLLEFLRNSPFKISLLINPVVFHKPVDEISPMIIDRLKKLYGSYDIRSVTVSNLLLADRIKKSIPQIKLHASVLLDIHKPIQLAYINDIFDVLVPSSRIVRDINALKAIRKGFKGQIKLIVNEGCLPHCVYRMQHFYEMGSKVTFPKSLCTQILNEKPWLRLTGSWILPQHLRMYGGLFDKLKLSGRVTLQNPDYYFDVLTSYILKKPRRPDKIGAGPVCGNLNMHISDNFFRALLHCSKECNTCAVCKNEYERYFQNLNRPY